MTPDDLGRLLDDIGGAEARDLAQVWVASLMRLSELGELGYITLGAVVASMQRGIALDDGLMAMNNAFAHAGELMRAEDDELSKRN